MKIDPEVLDELKYGFLELAAAETVDVSTVEFKQLIRKYLGN